MCQKIIDRYGYGPTVDKIRAAWSALGFNRSGYFTRGEFSIRARYELERILIQTENISYRPGMNGSEPNGRGQQPQSNYQPPNEYMTRNSYYPPPQPYYPQQFSYYPPGPAYYPQQSPYFPPPFLNIFLLFVLLILLTIILLLILQNLSMMKRISKNILQIVILVLHQKILLNIWKVKNGQIIMMRFVF